MNKGLLYLFFLLSVLSCKKESDEIFPEVAFQSPGFNSAHTVLDPIHFTINASDNVTIERITVFLLDGNLQSVAPSVSVTPMTNDYTYTSYIIPTDVHIASGSYYLKAVVSDGFQESVEYRQIYLNEIPRALKQVWVAEKIFDQIYFIDSIAGTTLQPEYTFTDDLSGIICNSWYGMLFAAGGKTGNGLMYRLGYQNPFFSVTNQGSGNENYFTALKLEGNKTYVATYDGLIRSFSYSSSPNDVYDLGVHFSEAITLTSQYLISASLNSSGLQRSIQTYQKSSGVFFQSTTNSLAVLKMFTVNDNEILLFGNESGTGRIKIYDPSSNQISEPFIFTGGLISDISIINSQTYLISHSGGITLYSHAGLTQSDLITGSPYKFIRYEDLSNTFYAATETTLKRFDITGTNMLEYINASDTIVGLDLLYNK